MSNALLSSKIIVTEEPPKIGTLSVQPTAVLGMVGITERGPMDTAVLSTSFDGWAEVFGGYTLESRDTVAAVEGFFEEGGQFLWFVRTARHTDINDPNSNEAVAATVTLQTPAASAAPPAVLGNLVGPFAMSDGQTIVISLNGAAGVTSTFNTGPASITSSNTETFALSDGQTLTISVDGEAAQTVTFNTADFAAIGTATAAEVAVVINEDTTDVLATAVGGAVVIQNTRGNGTGFDINPTGGTAAATLGFSAGAVTGTGDAADAAAVTVSELETMIEADVAGTDVTSVGGAIQIAGTTNGASQTLQVLASSTADTVLGLSNLVESGTDAATATNTLRVDAKHPGAYGDGVTVRIAAASSGDADEFDLIVLEDGTQVEQFNNLSMLDTAVGNYIEDVINAQVSAGGSQYIAVTDLDAGLGSATLDRPANADSALSGGDNGLTNIGDTDFIGSSIAENGLRALDVAGDLTLLAVPARATAAVHNAMLTYCEVTRNGTVFGILDPPAGLTAQEMVTYTETTALLLEASEYGAIYFPRVKVVNPSSTIFGVEDTVTVAPSGHIAGRYSRTDNSQPGGVYQPPAGLKNGRLSSIVGLEVLAGNEVSETFDVNKRDLLYPKRINPISEVAGGRILDGVRTLSSTGSFPTIAERRGVIFIEVTIQEGLEPARFRNNDDTLRAEVARTVEAFLISQMNVGAFRTRNPSTAFQVDFGKGLNPASVAFAGQLVGRIGLATQKPAEFIILKFTQDTRAIEQELSAT
jgi:phage tail sheath protein FI